MIDEDYCRCFICNTVIPEGMETCPHCNEEIKWTQCDICRRSLISDYTIGKLCHECFSRELYSSNMIKFSEQNEILKSKSIDALKAMNIPYFYISSLGINYSRQIIMESLSDALERHRLFHGIGQKDCEEFLESTNTNEEFADWINNSEIK